MNHEYAVPSRNVDAYRTFDFSEGNLPGCVRKMCSQRVRYTSNSWRSPENSAGGFTLGASVTILAGDGVRAGVTERCRRVSNCCCRELIVSSMRLATARLRTICSYCS